MIPLREAGLIEPKLFPKIFANIEEVCSLTQRMCVDLEARLVVWTETTQIGDVFLKFVSSLIWM